MTGMADPHQGLLSYQRAIKQGLIAPRRCKMHADLTVLVDDADGDPRLTYALTTASGTVQATVTYLPGSPYKGERCFQVGYAVAEPFRRQGLAVEVLRKSIDEMRLGFKSHFSKFYVEAVVGEFNVASMKVASKVMNSEPLEIVDEVSGEPALQYFLLIE